MNTPVYDFARRYADSDAIRAHMPGHKGRGLLGCEPLDLTEIAGADELYAPAGIIAESEANASALFGCRTLYSAEGSSLCIRAMLYLAMRRALAQCRKPVIAAARNAHRSFLTAAALLDLDVIWLPPDPQQSYLESGGAGAWERCLDAPVKPCALYLTSPDYLGNIADIRAAAAFCHAHDMLLLVDNAHGAYLHFLPESLHPAALGADLCCDSAHKTLPVLTGGAYLHIHEDVPEICSRYAKNAMALFGSTSPSWLILASLDLCNAYLCDEYIPQLRGDGACGYFTKSSYFRRICGSGLHGADAVAAESAGGSSRDPQCIARAPDAGADPDKAAGILRSAAYLYAAAGGLLLRYGNAADRAVRRADLRGICSRLSACGAGRDLRRAHHGRGGGLHEVLRHRKMQRCQIG